MRLMFFVPMAILLAVGCTKPNTIDWEKIFGDKDTAAVADDESAGSDESVSDEVMPDEAVDEVMPDETGEEDLPDEAEDAVTEKEPDGADIEEPEGDEPEPADEGEAVTDDEEEVGDDATMPDEDFVDVDTVDIQPDLDVVDEDSIDLDTGDTDMVVPDGDIAECVTGAWETENGVVSECVDGLWKVRRITRQWGTANSDYGSSVAVDASGAIYVTGRTDGALDGNTSAGFEDIFLTKWNTDGTKGWTKQWGTVNYDEGYSVAVDASGAIYVTGYTNGALDGNTRAGEHDIFLTKWNADGTRVWTKQWGTVNNDEGYSVAVDAFGAIYVTGGTYGALDGNTSSGGLDIFLTKWNTDGTKVWTKQWGTATYDYGISVAVDASGAIYVAGYTLGELDGNASAGWSDIFLTKWNVDGTKVWTKQWGTVNSDYGYSVAVDAFGAIYVTGWTYGALDGNTSAGERDIFLTKWRADGTKVWTKQWGTASIDYGYSVAVDASGAIYVTGWTTGALDGNTSTGGSDIFLTKWKADGTKAWTKQWGTAKDEGGSSVAVDASGAIYVTGITGGALDGNTSAGNDDIFLSIIPPN